MRHYIKTYILIILLILSGCSAEEEETSNNGSLTIKRAGFSDFGTVEVGNFKIAGFKIKNSTNESRQLNITGLGAPFTFHRIDGECSLVNITAGRECTILIRFTPTDDTQHSRNIGINGQLFNFKGKGRALGEISFSNPLWVGGTFQVGQIIQKTFQITNTGDIELTDFLTDTEGASIFSHTCGSEFEPNETCDLTIRVQKITAQNYTEQIRVYSTDTNISSYISFSGNATPGDPFGNIGIICDDTRLIANNTDITNCRTSVITDSFGNTVTDGHIVSATGFNLNIDGASTKPVSGGVVDFDIRATDSVGDSSLVLNSATASGFSSIELTSGPASGAITFKSFNDQVLADAVTTITVETNIMVNSSGVTLSNGEEIEVSLSGTGSLDSPTQYTYNGRVKVRFTTSGTPGTSTITLNSGPQYDGSGNLTGYSATGSFTVTMNPVPTAGNFNIVSDIDALYFDQNSSGYNDLANITVTVLNVFNQPAGSGKSVDVSLSNIVENSSGNSNLTLVTDANSEITFQVKGLGNRGMGQITVEADSEVGQFSLPIIGDTISGYSINDAFNSLDLAYTFADARFTVNDLQPQSSVWKDWMGDYSEIQVADNLKFGAKRVSGQWYNLDLSMKDYIWDCMLPVKNYVFHSPCANKKIDASDFNYGNYFPFNIKVDEQSPIAINGAINTLPNSPDSDFENDLLSPLVLYSSLTNKAYILGGAQLNSSADPIFSIENNNDAISYGQISLFGYLPYESESFSAQLEYPINASHSKKSARVYIFGGLKIDSNLVYAGNVLQEFFQGDLTTITVNPGVDGLPPARYQNAVYLDENSNTLYIIGGINTNDDVLDDIWSIDLNQVTKTWNRVCSVCSIPDMYTKRSQDYKDLAVGIADKTIFYDLDDVGFLKVIENKVYGEKILWYKRKGVTYSFDLTFSSFDIYTGIYSGLGGYDAVLYHDKLDRIYVQNSNTVGVSETTFLYKDMNLGDTSYYLAKFSLGDNAQFAEKVTPKIRAYSSHYTNGTQTYGVSAYCYNFTTSQWDLIGENLSNDPNSINSGSYEIKTDLVNPTNYMDINNDIFVLIRPSEEVGFVNQSSAEPSNVDLYINFLEVEGVY